MPRRDNDTPSKVRIFGNDGAISASVIFHQEQHYLHPNLIYVLGNREAELETMRLDVGGDLTWEATSNPSWPYGSDNTYDSTTTGSGHLYSSGAAAGLNIDEETIQTVAEIRILKTTECYRGDGLGGALRATYWFLQRPRHWRVYPRSLGKKDRAYKTGDWTSLGFLPLKFRVISWSLDRDDPRLSIEKETLEIPGIQIEPTDSNISPETFYASSDELWHLLRILLTVELRQHIATLREDRISPNEVSNTWHSVAVRPRERLTGHPADNIYYGQRLETYLKRGAVSLSTHSKQKELLHAAAHGYINSFDPLMWEAGLTSCVEAIERLVSVFEKTMLISRELIPTKEWKPLAKVLKDTVSTLPIGAAVAARLKKQLSHPPSLELEERILRMAKRYKLHSNTNQLFVNLARMIGARNAIVHGRLISDHNLTYVELIRSRAIFEKLFLCFCGCANFKMNGYALHVIENYNRRASE